MSTEGLILSSFYSMHQGLCHISELSANWLAKAEDVCILHWNVLLNTNIWDNNDVTCFGYKIQAFKVGDRVDVKLIEVWIRLSLYVLLLL